MVSWLRTWGKPETMLIGLEATGVLWEPLYKAVMEAGYHIVRRLPGHACEDR